jgi:hypothetical protein
MLCQLAVSLPRNPQLSADFVIDRNEMNQASAVPGTLKNRNNVVLVADDGFTAVKRTKAEKETFRMSLQSLQKNKQTMIGIRNPSSLPTIVKRVKIKSLFFSRFAPEVSTTDIEK